VVIDEISRIALNETAGYRLINSHYPPIDIFDDVADSSEFDALFALQELTNPRVRAEAGQLSMLERGEIPFGIRGCSYATAPFTHVNANGSRFSNGDFGILYIGDTEETAIREVRYHQTRFWPNIVGIKDDFLVMRGLRCTFAPSEAFDIASLGVNHRIHDPDDYSEARSIGAQAFGQRLQTPVIQYCSVRNPGAICWALLSPRPVVDVMQTFHCQFVMRAGGLIADVQRIQSMQMLGAE
jgi:hypothetical protein